MTSLRTLLGHVEFICPRQLYVLDEHVDTDLFYLRQWEVFKRCQTKSILEAKRETIKKYCRSESDRSLTGNVTSLLCLRDLLMTLSALVIICQCDIITRRKTSLHDAKHHYTPPQIIFSAGNKMSSLSQQLMSNTRSSSVNLMVSSNYTER